MVLAAEEIAFVDLDHVRLHVSRRVQVPSTNDIGVPVEILLTYVPAEVAPVRLGVRSHPSRLKVALMQRHVTTPAVNEDKQLVKGEIAAREKGPLTDGLL